MGWLSMGDVTWVGVAVATLAAFIVTFAWYHPRALGTVWARLAGVDLADLRAGVAPRAATTAVVMAPTTWWRSRLSGRCLARSCSVGFWRRNRHGVVVV